MYSYFMKAAHQGGLVSLLEEYQGHPHQLLAIAWLQLQMPEKHFKEFKALWFGEATIAVVPTSTSGVRVESSENTWGTYAE